MSLKDKLLAPFRQKNPEPQKEDIQAPVRSGILIITKSPKDGHMSQYEVEPTRNPDVWTITGGSRICFDKIMIENPYVTKQKKGKPAIIGEGDNLYFQILDVPENPECWRGCEAHTSPITRVSTYEPTWRRADRYAASMMESMDVDKQTDTEYTV